MILKQTVNEWKPIIKHAIDSKVSEFKEMGYTRATGDDIWKCLQDRLWKGNPELRIHEVVQDVMHLDVTMYMSYLTLDSYQNDDFMASIAALTGE